MRLYRLGLCLVEICDNMPLDGMSHEQLAALRDRAARRSVAISVGTRGIRLDHLRRHVDLARYLGSSLMRVVVDTATHEPTVDEVVFTLRQRRLLEEALGALDRGDPGHAKTCLAAVRGENQATTRT